MDGVSVRDVGRFLTDESGIFVLYETDREN